MVTATLGTIAERATEAGIEAPALVVIGDVVGCREQLSWFEGRPLHGVSVVVTRARDRAPALTAKLAERGAEVIELPVTSTEPIDAGDPRVAAGLERFAAGCDLVVFTSPAGVDRFFEILHDEGRDARSFAGTELAAVGPGTAAALSRHGLTVDHIPERFVAEGMLKALAPLEMAGRRVLLVRAEEGRELLPRTLAERGAEVTVMPVYRTVPEPIDPALLARAAAADFVTFASGSAVRSLVAAGVGDPGSFGPQVVAIGPVTAAAAREAGFAVAAEAERHDLDGLVETVTALRG